MAFLPEKTYFEETLVSGYSLSNGATAFTSSDVSKYITLSIQFIYSNSNGDNEMVIEQSNDSINWSELSESYRLPVGSGNFIIDKNTFSGKHIRISFKTVGSGSITIKILSKR